MKRLPDIAPLKKRKEEIDTLMAEENFFSNTHQSKPLIREHTELSRLIELYSAWEKVSKDLEATKELLKDPSSDESLRQLAAEEIKSAQRKQAELYQAVLVAMLPSEPTDDRNTIVEIRAGAGGDEASLFAADLYRLYTRFAEAQNWQIESLGGHASEAGGFKEITFLVKGEGVYKDLKYESGVHRVQRIPTTEAGGRIHTSTVTVAILPEAEEVDVKLEPNDLEITTTRASGAGGQHVNKTESAIQIIHKPTGFTVYCADERSQHRNKEKALKVLRARLLEHEQQQAHEAYASHRRTQVGTGDRSERIRTYNFPQNRVTDHRIGLTLHSLPQILEGGIKDLIEALRELEQKERIEVLFEVSVQKPSKPS